MNFIGYCVKTEVGTFRLNKKTLESLKKEADSESLSLNALVNKILETHINWHSSAAKLGIIPISSEVVGHLFKNMSDDDIKKLAKKQAPLITEDLLLLKQEDTLETFIDLAKDYFTVCGFPISIREKNDTIKITVRHGIGKKYSIYIEEIIRTKIELYKIGKSDVQSTGNTITFSVEY